MRLCACIWNFLKQGPWRTLIFKVVGLKTLAKTKKHYGSLFRYQVVKFIHYHVIWSPKNQPKQKGVGLWPYQPLPLRGPCKTLMVWILRWIYLRCEPYSLFISHILKKIFLCLMLQAKEFLKCDWLRPVVYLHVKITVSMAT